VPRRTKTEEGHLKTAVLDLLAADKIYALRVNSGDLLLTAPNGKKRLVKLAPKGTADVLAIVPNEEHTFMPLWLETKSKRGTLTPEQESFRNEVEARGHAYLVVTDTDQIMEWLKWFRSRD